MSVIEIKNLVKRFKELVAVDHLDLEVKEGEIFGLLGPNGSGKSTTINCLLSLLNYEKGEVKIFGKPMHQNAYDIKKDIGVVFQEVAVFEELNVRENIDCFCALYVKDKKERRKLVDEVIDFVGLKDHEKFRPKKLSGGLLRRLNIACGIAHKPKLIILDEPTVAVDPQSRNKILEGIMKLRDEGATILYTSHYMEEVEQICDRVAIIDAGKVVAQGNLLELKDMIGIGQKIVVELESKNAEFIEKISKLSFCIDIKEHDNLVTISVNKEENVLERVLDLLKAMGIKANKIYSEMPTLNDVFLEITGKELRD